MMDSSIFKMLLRLAGAYEKLFQDTISNLQAISFNFKCKRNRSQAKMASGFFCLFFLTAMDAKGSQSSLQFCIAGCCLSFFLLLFLLYVNSFLKRDLKTLSYFPGSFVWWICSNPKTAAADQRHLPKCGTTELNTSR